jgi:hypothetical protein
VEGRLDHAAEFPLGLVIGELSVLLTLAFNGLFLIVGGTARWQSMVLVVFLVHLPLAVLEGVILGFTVGFLARVKPEMLRGQSATPKAARVSSAATNVKPVLALFLLFASPAVIHAHRLNGAFRVLPDKRVQIQSFFPGGYPPRDATVKVFRSDDNLVAEGDLDTQGLFVFHYDKAENLRVVIRAAAGTIDEHTAIITILANDLTSSADQAPSPVTTAQTVTDENMPFANTEESWLLKLKDYLIGVGFLLAVAAFVLGLRNARQLRALKGRIEPPSSSDPEGSLT